MSHTLAIPRYRGAEGKFRRHGLLAGAVLGLIVGALGFAVAEAAAPQVRAALAAQGSTAVESLAEFPGRELPREWRWERPAVEFDSMYRQREAPRLDWIRDRGR